MLFVSKRLPPVFDFKVRDSGRTRSRGSRPALRAAMRFRISFSLYLSVLLSNVSRGLFVHRGSGVFFQVLLARVQFSSQFHQSLLAQKLFGVGKHLILLVLDVVLDVFLEDLQLHVPGFVIRRDVGDLREQSFYLLMLLVPLAHFFFHVFRSGLLDGRIEDLFFDGRVDGERILYLIENALFLFIVLLRRPFFLGEQFLDRGMIRFQQRDRVLFWHVFPPPSCIA